MPIPHFVRQIDLTERGISSGGRQTDYLIRNHGFPVGRMLSPLIRGWTEEEVTEWLASPFRKRSVPAAARVSNSRNRSTVKHQTPPKHNGPPFFAEGAALLLLHHLELIWWGPDQLRF